MALVRRDLSYLAVTYVLPRASAGAGQVGNYDMMAVSSAGADLPQPVFTFPSAGQYVALVDFWPQNGSKERVAVPLSVGNASTPPARLAPDASLTQTLGDLRLTLNSSGPMVARQQLILSIDAVNGQGQSLWDAIQAASGNQCQLIMVDESLRGFLRPDFVNRRKLQFAVNFPRPGTYKLPAGAGLRQHAGQQPAIGRRPILQQGLRHRGVQPQPRTAPEDQCGPGGD